MTAINEAAPVPAGLTAFYCPLDVEVSPDIKLFQQHTREWAERFDLGEGDQGRTRMLALTGSSFLAHTYPHATGAVGQALADYSAWGWVPNDVIGSGCPLPEAISLMGRWEVMMHSPRSWPSSADPRDAALADVMARLRDLMSPVNWERFAAAQGIWLYQMGWEASLREQNAVLSVNDYLVMRMGTGAILAAESYIDPVEGVELSATEWSRPAVRAAASAGLLAAALDNDRYSYIRERHLPVKKENLFHAVHRDHPELTFDEAIERGVAIRDRLMTLYLRLREQLLTAASDDLCGHLTGIDRIISGNFNFATATTRYLLANAADIFAKTDEPTDPSTAPLPYPAIAWWWEHLTP
ncbi:terpene synthase family protein [Streptomyces flavidovirens]